MKHVLRAFIILLCGLSLISCSNMNKQDVGTLAGGVAGGLIGSTVGGGNGRLLAIGAGTLAGAYIGNAVGRSMDETDKMKMNAAFETNAVGQPAYWHNSNTGASYRVTPTKNVTVRKNKYCREYRSTADIAGKQQQVYGTACRQPDGSWKVIS